MNIKFCISLPLDLQVKVTRTAETNQREIVISYRSGYHVVNIETIKYDV